MHVTPLLCAIIVITRYGSDNGKGANWHPTRAFHMLRGEAIAWIFSLVMLETVQMVESGLKVKSQADLLKGTVNVVPYCISDMTLFVVVCAVICTIMQYHLQLNMRFISISVVFPEYSAFLTDMTPPLPNPKKCGWPYHCESKPLCYTDYLPHYTENTKLSDLVVGTTQWVYDPGQYACCVAFLWWLCGQFAHGPPILRVALSSH